MLGIFCVTKLHVAAEAALAVCGRYILLACKRVKKHPAIISKKSTPTVKEREVQHN